MGPPTNATWPLGAFFFPRLIHALKTSPNLVAAASSAREMLTDGEEQKSRRGSVGRGKRG